MLGTGMRLRHSSQASHNSLANGLTLLTSLATEKEKRNPPPDSCWAKSRTELSSLKEKGEREESYFSLMPPLLPTDSDANNLLIGMVSVEPLGSSSCLKSWMSSMGFFSHLQGCAKQIRVKRCCKFAWMPLQSFWLGHQFLLVVLAKYSIRLIKWCPLPFKFVLHYEIISKSQTIGCDQPQGATMLYVQPRILKWSLSEEESGAFMERQINCFR